MAELEATITFGPGEKDANPNDEQIEEPQQRENFFGHIQGCSAHVNQAFKDDPARREKAHDALEAFAQIMLGSNVSYDRDHTLAEAQK